MGGGSGRGLVGHQSQVAAGGALAEMGRWLEDQGLSADALVPLLRYLRGLGAAPWTGPPVAVPARAGRDQALGPVVPDVRLLDADDLCRLWKVRKSWLYDAVERGEVPCLRLGKNVRFRPADVAAYLDRHQARNLA